MVNYTLLLREFEKIPRIEEPAPTIMEIAGFPHYENVSSNILSYYFDTKNPHGLKNLLLRSLLNCVSNELSLTIEETILVKREEPTLTQKRIDIVIETEDSVILIENKIYARMYNDLNDYSNHAETVYQGKTHKMRL